MRRAQAVVERDKPGIISALADRIPVLKQARRFERPGLAMKNQHLAAYIAEADASARMATDAFSTRQPLVRQLETIFGKDALDGGKVKDARFIGTPDQVSPFNDTILDMAQRSNLYDLTPAQRTALEALQAHSDRVRELGVTQYGLEIGRFKSRGGLAHLPNVDVSESALEIFGGDPSLAARVGRAKPRIWDNAAERLASDPTFKPETNIRRLVNGMDEAVSRMAGRKTFLDNLGGKTRLEVLQETHPALYAKMEALRGRLTNLSATARRLGQKQADSIDEFLASPHEADDITALEAGLTITRGKNLGKTINALNAEIDAARAEIKALRPAWEAANPKPYAFLRDVYKYFLAEDIPSLRQLSEVSNAGFIDFIENWRATVLGGDLSPLVGVQTPLGFLFDPYGVSRQWTGGLKRGVMEKNVLRAFRPDALATDVRDSLESWLDFASFMGRSVQAGTPTEFAGGWLRLIPGYSKVNEAMYVGVMRQQKRLFDDLVSSRMLRDLDPEMARAVAADQVSKVYPQLHPRALGQGPARAKFLRSTLTSVSFVRQPVSLTMDAVRGYVKLGTGIKLTPKERVAVQLITTLAASVMSASITSSILTAEKQGTDLKEALKRVVDPTKGTFASIIIGNRSIPLGGPFRAIVKAIVPRKVEGSPVPVPFAGLPGYVMGRITPAVRTQIDFLRDKDFFGNKIRQGKFPENVIRGILYEMEGVLPLTAGAIVEAARTGQLDQLLSQAAGQFAGVNIGERTIFQQRDIAVQQWGKPLGITATRYFDLSPSERVAFDRDNPTFKQAAIAETERRAKAGQERAIGQLRYNEAEAKRLADETLLAKEWDTGKVRGDDFRERYENIQLEAITRKQQVNIDFERFQETGKLPDDPNKAALVQWYDTYEQAKIPGGLDFDKLDSLQAGLQRKWTSAQKVYVELNTGVSEHPPRIREYLDAKKFIRESGYWDIGKSYKGAPLAIAAWQNYLKGDNTTRRQLKASRYGGFIRSLETRQSQQREAMRVRSPEVDAALVKWYGYTPKTKQGKEVVKPKPRGFIPIGNGIQPLIETNGNKPRTPVPPRRFPVPLIEGISGR